MLNDALSSMTIGEGLATLAAIGVVYTFARTILSPLMQKWFKIDKNSKALSELADIPERVSALEQKSVRDFNRINDIDEVNVLMMKALLVLLHKNKDGADKDTNDVNDVEKEINDFLVGKVRS